MLTVAIPTYGRDQVLIETLAALLALDPPPAELLVLDQTLDHEAATEQQLRDWQSADRLRWIRLDSPSITGAMNVALQQARGERILFLDDDILPDADLLLAHDAAAQRVPDALIAGRVLQPWHSGQPDPEDFTHFRFNGLQPRPCDEFIGCHFSVCRQAALDIGGFDQNFVRVAFRFESEFAHRWRRAGFRIRYEPHALIHHLKAERGGTRSYGEHLTTVRPDHAVGRYYFRLRTQPLLPALWGSARDLARSIHSRHHLRHPWWIPLTLLAEGYGLLWALQLHRRGPRLLPSHPTRLLIISSHPIQYQAPLFRALAAEPSLAIEVLFLSLPDARSQGVGFGVPFQWDLPLLEGYRWRQAASVAEPGLQGGFFGLQVRRATRELAASFDGAGPTAVLCTGWQYLGLLQMLLAARARRLPILLRLEANDLRPRRWPVALLHRLLIRSATACLPIGAANARFYRRNGARPETLHPSPYFIDNHFFAERATAAGQERAALRARWGIASDAFCFLFAGKLQPKKHPLDLLEALRRLSHRPGLLVHLLMVGSGELEAGCRTFAAEQRLPVSFAGFLNQTEIPDAYAAADALVLPSDAGETWGLVVNEAMACGRPAIVSDLVGCAEDLVQPGRTGLLVPCGDPTALAAAMETLAADRLASARMGELARQRVTSRYGVEQAVAGVLSACRTLSSR